MNIKLLAKIPRNFLIFALSIGVCGMAFAATPPSQVTGVKAELVGDNSVLLSWDEATSEEGVITGYRIYYGTHSVQKEGEVYDDEIQVTGDRTSYPIENLDYGKTYYFAVTAEDDELNQSLNYSEEVSVEIPAKPEEETTTEPEETETPAQETEQPTATTQQPEQAEPQQIPETTEPEKPAAPVIDITAPVDATNLVVDKSDLKDHSTVTIRWKKSADLDGDVTDQMFFVKKGNGNWDNGYSIGKDLEEMVFDVQKNKDYQIKIVTLDKDGNRSNGATATFSTETLATSGPGMIIPFAIAAIVMFFFLSFKRRS